MFTSAILFQGKCFAVFGMLHHVAAQLLLLLLNSEFMRVMVLIFSISYSPAFLNFDIRDGLPAVRREVILVGKGSNQRIKFSYIRIVGTCNVL